jgi:hypothetical protein
MTHSWRGQLLVAVPLGATALAILALEAKLAEAPALERSAMQAQIAQYYALVVQRQALALAPVLPPDGKIHITTRNAADNKSWSFRACDICAWRPGPPGVTSRDFTLTPIRTRIKQDPVANYYCDPYQDAWRTGLATVSPRDFTRTRMLNEINEVVGYYYNPYEGPHTRPIPPGTLPSPHDDYQPPDTIANRWPWIGIDRETHSPNYGGLAGQSWAPR